MIQEFFGVGSITINKNTVNYQVTSMKDLLIIIEHFNKYLLRTKKHKNFILFAKAYDIIANKEHLINLQWLVNIRASLNKGLPKRLALDFPDTKPEVNQKIMLRTKKDVKLPDFYHWIAGFVTGEGCFFVKTSKSKTHKLGLSVNLNFIVVQNLNDTVLMEEIKSALGCGSITINERSHIARFSVTKLSDTQKIIIPFLDKYPIVGEKVKDYEDFKKVSNLITSKSHLTEEGLKEILAIKSKMNFNRK